MFPRSINNWISYVGLVIAAIAAVIFVMMFGLVTATSEAHPYGGLVVFVLLPPVFVFGLFLVLVGMWKEIRHRRRTGKASVIEFPRIDLNNPLHRNTAALFLLIAMLIGVTTLVASYAGYEYTESVGFCGRLCHTVMEPEYVTYQHSPHARVACVECHVGPGAGWYVKSKLSGLYQVYAVLFNKYPRPIDTPIHNLRPARETCEHCHWPQKFWGNTERRRVHFMPNEENKRWEIQLLVKTGGVRKGEEAQGIHWHMDIQNEVQYLPKDEKRQEIPWVKLTNRKTGESTVFTVEGQNEQLTPDEQARVRVADCMDCHNRPSHNYKAPSESVNGALESGAIAQSLPNIKSVAVEALIGKYATAEEAKKGIADHIMGYYQKEKPEIASARSADLQAAIAAVQEIYSENFFPEMKARWDIYPENDGHFRFAGCFRCHDGKHKSSEGKVVSLECNSCHTILAQGEPGKLEFAKDENGLEFKHPEDIGDMWKDMACYECHGSTPEEEAPAEGTPQPAP